MPLLLAFLVLLLLPAVGLAQNRPPPPDGASGRQLPRAGTRQADTRQLLDELARAPDATAAAALEARLGLLWAQGASPAVTLLLRRADRNAAAGNFAEAVEDLDAAITLQPDHADSWILRARAQARLGDAPAAASDLREALRLEPRHFGALLALSSLQEERGDLAGALRSLKAVLRLNPRMSGGGTRLRDLRRRALGDDT